MGRSPHERRRRFGFGGIILSALLFAATLAAAPASAQSDRLGPPIWSEWEQKGDHIHLSWRVWEGTEKVNVYRNDQYLTTVSEAPIWRYSDYGGGVGDEYYLVAIGGDGQFSEKSGRVSAVHEEVPVPRFKMVGQADGHISVAWDRMGVDSVNVYRNGRYIASVHFPGNVYSDFSGRVGDEYYLVGVEDGRFSKKSEPKTAAGTSGIEDHFGAQIDTGYSPERGASASLRVHLPNPTVSRDAGIRSYLIYRNDSGFRMTYPHHGTRVGVGQYTSFVDPDPVTGASYGVVPVRNDGTTLAMVLIQPDYDGAIDDFIQSRQARGGRIPVPVPAPVPPNPPNPNNPNDPNDWQPWDPRDPSNWIDSDPASKSLQDLLDALSDWIDRVVEGVRGHFDDNFGPGTTADEVVANEIDRLEGEGFTPMPGYEDSHMVNGGGSIITITQNGATTTITQYTPDWHDPTRPSSVSTTEITENPNGTVTRNDNHLNYGYPPNGDPVVVSLNNEIITPAPAKKGDTGGQRSENDHQNIPGTNTEGGCNSGGCWPA